MPDDPDGKSGDGKVQGAVGAQRRCLGLRLLGRDDIQAEMWKKSIPVMRNSISCVIGGMRGPGLFGRLGEMPHGERTKCVMACLG